MTQGPPKQPAAGREDVGKCPPPVPPADNSRRSCKSLGWSWRDGAPVSTAQAPTGFLPSLLTPSAPPSLTRFLELPLR